MKLDIDTSQYRYPTDKEIADAKKFILRRENYAQILDGRVDDILTEAAGEIAQICLKYNIPAKDFTMSSNSKMFQEVSDVMDAAEERIMALIEDFSTRVTDDNGKKKLILLWIASLGRNNMNLQQTLDGYMYRYLYDLEAIIAAYKLRMENNTKLTSAAVVSQIKASQHSVYTNPAVVAAMSARNITQMQARYIRSHGNHKNDGVPLSYVGVSNSNANNIVNMAKLTMRMAWSRDLAIDYTSDKEIVGFYVARGSSYPCDYCQSYVGYHPISEADALPPRHNSCQCYVIPIYGKVENEDNEKIWNFQQG